MKNKIILILGFIGLAMISNTNVGKAQVYDEEVGLCKLHPNYQYEMYPETTPLHLALARIFISECGYDCERDHVPIYDVLRNRSRDGILRIEKMMSYSPKSFNFELNRRTRYIAYLNESGEQPLYWEEANPNLKWENYRDRWFHALRIAHRLVNGERIPSPCSGRVDHWGAPTEGMAKQAYANGNVPAYCPGTRNRFWTINIRRRIEMTSGTRVATIEE